MRKTWSNGYISVVIDVKPLVSTEQEQGFISPELYGMLAEAEKSELRKAQAYYEQMAASLSKAQSDQFKPESTISTTDIFRNFDNRDRAASHVADMVANLQVKYGMAAPEVEATEKGAR